MGFNLPCGPALCGALALGLLLCSHSAAGDTYFVSTTGDDGNPGTQQQPWRTLQHAADAVAAGDTVFVLPGAFAGFDLRRAGTPDQPITFSAQPGTTIDQDNPVTPDGINLEGVSYVVVEGFEVMGATRAGIRAALCHHVTIRGNRTDLNGKWGIFTGFCDDLRIEANQCSRSALEHGIYVSNSSDRPAIRGNLIWSNHGNGIHINGDLSQGGDGVITGAVVERNIVFDNGAGGGSGINADGVQDSRFQNNLLFQNHASGISLYRIDGGAPSSGNQVLHNTVLQASDGRWGLNIRDASGGNTIYNNIFYNLHSFRGSISIDADSLPGTVSDHNAVMDRFTTDGGDTILSLAAWRAATGLDLHSILSTPAALFADWLQADYHLAPGSPAIDLGTAALAPPADLEGTPRPIGPGYDAGAYEYTRALFAAPGAGGASRIRRLSPQLAP